MWFDYLRVLELFVSVKFGAANVHKVSSMIWRQIMHGCNAHIQALDRYTATSGCYRPTLIFPDFSLFFLTF
jgi:hypothetical protein